MGAKLQLLFVTSKFLGGKMKGIYKGGLMTLCHAIKKSRGDFRSLLVVFFSFYLLYIIVSHDGNCYS